MGLKLTTLRPRFGCFTDWAIQVLPLSCFLLTLHSLLRWTPLLPLNYLWANDPHICFSSSDLSLELQTCIQLPIQHWYWMSQMFPKGNLLKTSPVVLPLVVFLAVIQAGILVLTTFPLPPFPVSHRVLLILPPKYLSVHNFCLHHYHYYQSQRHHYLLLELPQQSPLL